MGLWPLLIRIVQRCVRLPVIKNWVTKSNTGTDRAIKRIVEEIDGYIYYYNNERIQMKLDGLSPIQYRLSKTTMKK